MWRTVRYVNSKSKLLQNTKQLNYSNSASTSDGGGSFGKLIVGVIGATGLGFAGAIVYGKYEPKFKKTLEENVPYIDHVYKWFPETSHKSSSPKIASEEKLKDVPLASNLRRKKPDSDKEFAEVHKSTEMKSDTGFPKTNEKLVSDMIKNLSKSLNELSVASDGAISAVKLHTKTLYEALDTPEGKDSNVLWTNVKRSTDNKNIALRVAEDKANRIHAIVAKLNQNLEVLKQQDVKNPLLDSASKLVADANQQIQKASEEIDAAVNELKTASEFQKLVNESTEQFKKELGIILPGVLYGDKDKATSESDLNVLVAHAHRRIERLQKEIAKLQTSGKEAIGEENRQQIADEESQVSSVKNNFEQELRKQLSRQAAAHADHLKEALYIQGQELDRQFALELEEKLLHQKGVFISDVSGNMARSKGILAYLKAKNEFFEVSQKSQALWLACQTINDKIEADNDGKPYALGKDVAILKAVMDDNDFMNTVLAAIPPDAVIRGTFNSQVLKQRFQNVKKSCRKVALINDKSDSLYRYFLSHLQSFFIVDNAFVPKEELEGKVAVDPSTWDTYDILMRISYSLQINDMAQALRYANQLKGEPKNVAKEWIKEVRLLLETQLVVKALLAHATAIGVQAYH